MSDSTVKRGPGGKWLPGSVPNPKGRPKSKLAFGDAVRRGVDPNELRDILLSIARGQGYRMTVIAGSGEDGGKPLYQQTAEPPTYKERIAALDRLLKYGWLTAALAAGQPEEPPEVRGPDLTKMTPEQLKRYSELIGSIASGQPPPALEPAVRTFIEVEAATAEDE